MPKGGASQYESKKKQPPRCSVQVSTQAKGPASHLNYEPVADSYGQTPASYVSGALDSTKSNGASQQKSAARAKVSMAEKFLKKQEQIRRQ